MSRPRKKVTIKHIADECGLSFSTVAKALKNDPAIREETRARVRRVAEKLNYYPSRLASGLRLNATRTVGIILNDVKNPFYAEIYGEIEDILNQRDYTMLLCDSNFDTDLERKNILALLSQGVDGLIVSPVDEASSNLDLLVDNGMNSVILDCKPRNRALSYVYPNHEMAAALAVTHLIEQGHRDILLLTGPEKLSSSRRFLEGYRSTLQQHGVPFRSDLVVHTEITPDHANKILTAIFAGSKDTQPYSIGCGDFTAVATLSDLLALGVYKAVSSVGLTVPEDVSVVGYDNIFATEYVAPPLTTVNQPKKETGRRSIELLLRSIKEPQESPTGLVLDPHIVVRDSVRRLA